MFPMFREGQRGVGLVAAVFLLIVIAGLIAFLLRMSGLQHSTGALDVQGARAFQSARAGIEWGVYRALRDNSCAASASFGLAGDLSDFTVTVQCVDTPYTEVDPTVKHVYSIVATACNRPVAGACPGTTGPFYVERQLQALVDRGS
ncbi:MAG: agglutinin biogenesis protein MshP [Betaproteobacteria bacterium]|nr:MAG: agglutinin biogenesis protein MshP [Betaproteobacteria bacterium]